MNLNQTEAHEPGLKGGKHSCSWAGVVGDPWFGESLYKTVVYSCGGAEDKRVEAV